MTAPIRLLFVCTHNSARSQIAEALLTHEGGPRFEASSAGTEATRVHPLALRVLADAGIDWSGARSKTLAEFAGRRFDYVVTVCSRAAESCPVFPGARTLHWDLEDPSAVEGTDEERLAAFQATEAEIRVRLAAFITEASPA